MCCVETFYAVITVCFFHAVIERCVISMMVRSFFHAVIDGVLLFPCCHWWCVLVSMLSLTVCSFPCCHWRSVFETFHAGNDGIHWVDLFTAVNVWHQVIDTIEQLKFNVKKYRLIELIGHYTCLLQVFTLPQMETVVVTPGDSSRMGNIVGSRKKFAFYWVNERNRPHGMLQIQFEGCPDATERWEAPDDGRCQGQGPVTVCNDFQGSFGCN